MNWQANWIWLNGERKQNTIYAHARRVFEIEGEVEDASLAICANNIYRLTLNGERVGRGPDRSDPKFPYYDTYDVARCLKKGRNVIALDLCCITSETDRGRSWCLYGGDPGLLLQLDYTDGGEKKRLCTDESWRMIESPAWRKDAPRITRFMGFIEHRDANAAATIDGYRDGTFDDSAWESPALLGVPPNGPIGDPIPREIPFLVPKVHPPRTIGSLQQDIVHSDNETHLLGFAQDEVHAVCTPGDERPTGVRFDFGRTMGGMPRICLADCCGGRMEVYYTENTREVLCDIVELPEQGELEFEPIDWRGARYVTLLFYRVPKPTVLKAVEFIELEYPFAYHADFEADDPMLGRIWRACKLTAHVATKDHPQDCVHREQALWYSDVIIHVQTTAACFGDLTPFVKACRQAIHNVNDDGILAVPGPCTIGYHYNDESLPWSEQALTVPMSIAHILDFTGDDALGAFAAPAVKRIMGHFARYEDERGLLFIEKPGVQALEVFTGWSSMLKSGVPVNANAEYVLSLRAAARIVRAGGDAKTAAEYEEKAERVGRALVDLFYSREDHLFMDGEKDGEPLCAFSPTVNGWAALAGLLPEGEEGAWAHAMEHHPQIGEIASPYDASTVLEALFQVGATDLARRLLEDCWGGFIRRGEPCVPEHWLPGHSSGLQYGYKNVGSRCHPYGTGPAYCFQRYLLGIRMQEPGYASIAIEPQPMGLRFVRGRMLTPRGEIEVVWRRDATEWVLETVLPEGVTATVTLPRVNRGAGQMTCDGEIVWQDSGWTRFADARRRRPHRDLASKVSTKLTTPGRHVVVMTVR